MLINVLIVEDDVKEAEGLRKIVSKIAGVQGFWSRSAEGALELLAEVKFDFFILDVQLPGEDGMALAGRIRERKEYRLTPILFVTGADRNPLKALTNYHCYDYIEKPYCQEELYEKLSTLAEAIADLNGKNEGASEEESEALFLLATGEGEFCLRKKELLFIEISNGRGIFHMKSGEIEKKGVSLSGILEDLDDADIVRCHKSFAVNIRTVAYIDRAVR